MKIGFAVIIYDHRRHKSARGMDRKYLAAERIIGSVKPGKIAAAELIRAVARDRSGAFFKIRSF